MAIELVAIQMQSSRWEVELDLTPIASTGDYVVFYLSHDHPDDESSRVSDIEKDRLCREALVAFLGPDDYIPISPRKGYYDLVFML